MNAAEVGEDRDRPTVLCLTAGLGTRLRPITQRWAKPAVPFLNVPMLGFSVSMAERLCPKRLIFNTHYLPETVERAVNQVISKGAYDVMFSHESPEILGRGGAIKKAQPWLEGGHDFLLLNGDSVNLFARPAAWPDFWRVHRQKKSIATLLLTPFAEDRGDRSAVWVDDRGRVQGFGPQAPRPHLRAFHYPGALALRRDIFAAMPDGVFDIFYDTFVGLIRDGVVIESHVVDNIIGFETGNARDYLASTARCLNILADTASPYHADLAAHLRRLAPTLSLRLTARGRLWSGPQTRVSGILEGFAVLPDGVDASACPRIENAVVLTEAVFPRREPLIDGIFF